ERFTIPMPLGCDLGQQQSAIPTELDDQAVASDADVLGSRDRLEWSEERQLDVELPQLGRRNRRKPRIFAGRGDRAARNHAPERLVIAEVTDAAAQLAGRVERDERPALPRERTDERRPDGGQAGDVRYDRVARQLEERAAVCLGDHDAALENRPSAAAM